MEVIMKNAENVERNTEKLLQKLEELEDIRAIEERKHDKTISYEKAFRAIEG